jgi:hypothetical protein
VRKSTLLKQENDQPLARQLSNVEDEYDSGTDTDDESGIHMAARAHAAELKVNVSMNEEEAEAGKWPR